MTGAWSRSVAVGASVAASAVGASLLLASRRWSAFGVVVAVGATVVATIAALTRALVPGLDRAPLEAETWVVVWALVVAATALRGLRTRPPRSTAVGIGAGVGAAAVVLAAAGSVLLGHAVLGLGAHPAGGSSAGAVVRVIVVVAVLSAVGAAGWAARRRVGVGPAVGAAVSLIVFAVVALAAFAVEPVETVTVITALALVALGARRLRRDPAARSWPALGGPLALLLVPSLLFDLGETTLWRVVAVGVFALGLVVVGAVRKLQAPLVLGAIILPVHATAQRWPWVSQVYQSVPWWLWLSVGGALLIAIRARYERRVQDLKSAAAAIGSLR